MAFRIAVLAFLILLAVPAAAGDRIVHLVNIGWHTGIALAKSDIDPAILPEANDLPEARWIEFGWGDAAFYQDPDPAIATYLSAMFIETPAVMHLAGLPAHPARYFPSAEVVDVPLDEAAFDRLTRYIADSFKRPDGRPAPPLGPGLYPDSRFYDAVGTFTLANTCNTWVARGFSAAGLDLGEGSFRRASTVTEAVRAALLRR